MMASCSAQKWHRAYMSVWVFIYVFFSWLIIFGYVTNASILVLMSRLREKCLCFVRRICLSIFSSICNYKKQRTIDDDRWLVAFTYVFVCVCDIDLAYE